ncbi:hypothetical protein [Streptomyces yaizuensis]|uniref:Type 2 lantipeptide synthetase LanM n=1 Tax=Streptomyces yaizuensis TaxID=2989713 RepID=A0ABQ5NTY5_9ACTN|nr:hypothetical protein [Streptomyces sp. YSPA8]GLF93608.1 type 2 lantipeptide synthetase LanM [Streptomyces sp. YSPA8]
MACLLALLLAVTGLTAFDVSTARPAGAASAGCPGRPDRVYPFATGELRVHRSARHVCAVTVAKKPGKRRFMSVSLQPRGGRPKVDAGRYTRLAGPVTVYAHNRCVRATGKVGRSGRSSGWILC